MNDDYNYTVLVYPGEMGAWRFAMFINRVADELMILSIELGIVRESPRLLFFPGRIGGPQIT